MSEPTPVPVNPSDGSPRPAVVPPDRWIFPTPQEHRLANGVRLLVHDLPGQYVVSVRIAIPHALASEPRDREGVATLLARLLDEGTQQHSAEEFAALLERRGIAVGGGASEAGIALDVDVPKRFLPDALDLARQMLAEPAFPENEVRRAVASRLAEIEQERASAPHRSARELIATMYAPTDRASRPTGGSASTVAAVARDDIVAHHARAIGPQGCIVVVAGDLAGLDVAGLVASTLGAWTNPDHVPPSRPAIPAVAADWSRVVVVDRPGSVQSEISIACPGPDRHVDGDAGWSPYPVLGYLVGGSPNARVDAVLREDKGYTYGIRSTFRPRRAGGMFLTSGSVRGDVTVESVSLLVSILDAARGGFDVAEARAGADFVARTAPGRYATADQVADESVMVAVDGLPSSFTTDVLDRMRTVTPQELRTAYERFVDGRWSIVVVGDASAWVDDLRAVRHDVTVVAN